MTPASRTPPPCEPSVTGPAPVPLAPGSPAAVDAGCRCSVLANAAYRCGAAAEPLLDPACPLDHGVGPG
ncbi:hypothetical protein ACQPX6_17970 [Actinomycetospora sp. CA-101289]|uniref:hypothetical protein n=1 Tax=Actinomycetospora sp. CA-101289 TaxID=3239893 RepID=UPI003D9685E8